MILRPLGNSPDAINLSSCSFYFSLEERGWGKPEGREGGEGSALETFSFWTRSNQVAEVGEVNVWVEQREIDYKADSNQRPVD